MIALRVVIDDEFADLSFQITWQEIVFQKHTVFHGLVSSLNLALGLWMVGCTAGVLHVLPL